MNQGSIAGPLDRGLVQADALEIETRVEEEAAPPANGVVMDCSLNGELRRAAQLNIQGNPVDSSPFLESDEGSEIEPALNVARPRAAKNLSPIKNDGPFRFQEGTFASRDQVYDPAHGRRGRGDAD